MTTDEVIRAYAAAKRLRALYDAYRATSHAHLWVLRRIAKAHEASTPAGTLGLQRLHERAALSRQADLAFRARAEDLRRRLEELRKENPIP